MLLPEGGLCWASKNRADLCSAGRRMKRSVPAEALKTKENPRCFGGNGERSGSEVPHLNLACEGRLWEAGRN